MTAVLESRPELTVASIPVRPQRTRRVLDALLTGVGKSVAVVALLAVWEAAPRLGLVDATFLPSFSTVLGAWWDLLVSGQLLENTQASLARSLAGFGLAVAGAVPLGLLIGWYKPVATLLGPLLELFRNTAALALLPVFVLLLGIGETSKIAIVFYACTWPILLNTISAVGGVDPTLLRLAKSMNLSGFGEDSLPVPEAAYRGVVLHEFGHALGFLHEHQSPDAHCEAEFDPAKVAAGLRQYADRFNRNATVQAQIGEEFHQRKDLGNAALYYQRAIQLDPKLASAWANLGALHAADIAHGKAYGCVAVGVGGRTLQKMAVERPHFIGALGGLTRDRLTPVPGGVLIRDAAGTLLGAVGISGDTSDNDELAAVAGIEAAGLKADAGSA